MSLRTVIYLRKSTKDKDEKQIQSIPRQRAEIIDFVERYNHFARLPEDHLSFDPDKDIVMEDASAKVIGGRPKFQEMIERIEKNKYDVLLTFELSRLSRNVIDNATIIHLLERGCLKRIQTKDNTFHATPTSVFMLGNFLLIAKYENDQRAVNTKSGMAHQKSRGETTNRAPLGYINAGKKKGRRWIEEDRDFGNMRRLWDLLLTGNYSISDIYREGERMGITYQARDHRKQPTESAYRAIFQNRYYLGLIKTTDADGVVTWVKGNHPAMVTEEEFDQVQLILQGRGYRHQQLTREPSIEAILNEILYCGKCTTVVNGIERQSKMTYEGKFRCTCGRCGYRFTKGIRKECPKCKERVTLETKIDSHRYYRCCKKLSSKACSHDFYGEGKVKKNVKAEEIEAFLDKQISKLYISDALFEVLRRQLYTLWLQANDDLAKRIDLLEAQRAGVIEGRRKMRKSALENGASSETEKEDVDFLMDDARKTERDLDRRIEELREREEEAFEKAWQTLQAMREAKSVLGSPSMDIEPKRKLILSMVSNLTITDEKWTIEWKKPFDTAANVGIVKMTKPKAGAISRGSKLKWLSKLYLVRDEITGTCKNLEAAFSLFQQPVSA